MEYADQDRERARKRSPARRAKDNSPPIHRWVQRGKENESRQGRQKRPLNTLNTALQVILGALFPGHRFRFMVGVFQALV